MAREVEVPTPLGINEIPAKDYGRTKVDDYAKSGALKVWHFFRFILWTWGLFCLLAVIAAVAGVVHVIHSVT